MSGSMDPRVDQGSQPPPTPVPPTTAAGILRARAVIIFGTGVNTGIFVYSGTPALGNPPQFAVVPTGVTTDPFGNAITSSSILVQGNVITETGGVFRTAAAAPLIQLDGPHNAILLYNAAAALTETVASITTSDGLGNTVQQGFTAYGGVNTTYASLIAAALQFHTSGDTASPQVSEIANAGLNLNSGQTAALTVEAIFSLNSAAAGVEPLATLSAALELVNAAATPAVNSGGATAFGSGGQLRVVDGADANNYTTERLTLVTTGTQTISSTTPATVTGLSAAVSSGRTYRIRGRISGTIGATATTIKVQISGPAISSMEVGYWFAQNNPGGATLFTATQTAISTLAQPTTTNQGIGSNFTLEYDGIVTFSAAGTIAFQAAETTNLDTWQTNANSYMQLEPV